MNDNKPRYCHCEGQGRYMIERWIHELTGRHSGSWHIRTHNAITYTAASAFFPRRYPIVYHSHNYHFLDHLQLSSSNARIYREKKVSLFTFSRPICLPVAKSTRDKSKIRINFTYTRTM